MLNSGCNASYKDLARKTKTRECPISLRPIDSLVVDFRSRLFRYMRLKYANRTYDERARSVFRAMKDLRLTGDVPTEKKMVFFSALATTKEEVRMMGVSKFTYVFPSHEKCDYKKSKQADREKKTQEKLSELKNCIDSYKRNMFDVDELLKCALALENYIISDLERISTMYSGIEYILGVDYAVPDIADHFESDRLCARLARERGTAILSEDFDDVLLFGADMMVKEVYLGFFVYVSLKDTMETFDSVSRRDAIHRCCIMGTDYNIGIKGIGPVKAKKIDCSKAKELFETCMSAQSMRPEELYSFFLLSQT